MFSFKPIETIEEAEKVIRNAGRAGIVNAVLIAIEVIIFTLTGGGVILFTYNFIFIVAAVIGALYVYKKKKAGLLILDLQLMIMILVNFLLFGQMASLVAFIFLYYYIRGGQGFQFLVSSKTGAGSISTNGGTDGSHTN